MVSWWKRLIYSLVSVAAGVIICEAIITIGEVIFQSNSRIKVGEFLPDVLIVFLFSLPGWVLAIPIVLIVHNILGWRFWMYLMIGSAIGPLLMFGIALYGILTNRQSKFSSGANPLLMIGTAVSCSTTLIYLLLLRRAQSCLG